MSEAKPSRTATFIQDATAGLVVFLVALPLCLGVALASNAPLFSGMVSGIIGGIVVGLISRSHTSVSGPAAGLTAVVAAQIATLGSFESFLVAVFLAGLIQLAMGLCRMGFIAAFIPSSVIKGLLAAIGLILILKQVPHVVGHDKDPEGEMSFVQPDNENTFTEIRDIFNDYQEGAAAIGLLSVLFLIGWDRVKFLKYSPIPAPLLVVTFGIGMKYYLDWLGGMWAIENSHLVQVPIAESWDEFRGLFKLPNFLGVAKWWPVIVAAFTIAIVASLETLLNLSAVDKLDPAQRTSPPNRELVAQGVGNTLAGLLGGLPVTSVIVRSSVNIAAGGKTKLSTIIHGFLLLSTVALIPALLNKIPLSCLGAILLVTGVKLCNPKLFKQMWEQGYVQFLPFVTTIVAIILTDLLIGILIGLAVSIAFILYSNFRRPLRIINERHVGGEIVRIELANQVSFLNRAALAKKLHEIPPGGHVLLDARQTAFIDPDILDLIEDFKVNTAPVREVQVSLMGFQKSYRLQDDVQFVDFSTREVQSKMQPVDVLRILQEGNKRFREGHRLNRDMNREIFASAAGQYPIAAIVSCIDSRSPAELIFDLGLGDVFSIRIAAHVVKDKVLASLEYACAVAGTKLIVVLGHTGCGAVTTAVKMFISKQQASKVTGCEHIDVLIDEIQKAIDPTDATPKDDEMIRYIDGIARRNVLHSVDVIRKGSTTLQKLEDARSIAIVGAVYDIRTGMIDFLPETLEPLVPEDKRLELASLLTGDRSDDRP